MKNTIDIKYFIVIILTAFLFSGVQLKAEKTDLLRGKITDKTKEPLVGAKVYWLNTNIGTYTDSLGEFQISTSNVKDKKLVVTYFSLKPDTLDIIDTIYVNIELEGTINIGSIEVKAVRPGKYISLDTPVQTEVITQQELKKTACCDLSGCFETQATVHPTTTNIITNSKELRLLGLSGVYTQTLIDGMPLIQGLSYTYGVSSFPGILIDNIYVAKGASSVLQGFENISGQINVELKKPGKSENFLLNGFLNSFFEKHINSIYSERFGNSEQWGNIAAIHIVQPSLKYDRDDDTFLDLPLLTRYFFYNKTTYGEEKENGFSTTTAFYYLIEERIGGQKTFNPKKDKGSDLVYGQTVDIQQPSVYSKTTYRLDINNAIVLFVSGFYQHQISYFGSTKYLANQFSWNTNIQYELVWNESQILKTGISFRYLNLNEDITFIQSTKTKTYSGNYKKNEAIYGIFAENIFNWGNRFTWIAGIRTDFHNKFGVFITPRTLIKYDLDEDTDIRASVGTGFRTVNLFSENISLLASQRNIIITEPLKPEKGISVGISLNRSFEFNNITGLISIDFYKTRFFNQIFPDYDREPTKALISNFGGNSTSNAFQVELNTQLYNIFSIRVAYNYLNVYRIVNGGKYILPFNPLHKILVGLYYAPKSNKWNLALNIHWIGKQYQPNTQSLPAEYQQPGQSLPYTLISAQYSITLSPFELYIGSENILDFRQDKPIIGWQNPFGPYFDTSSTWGPTKGRELYLGIRFIID